MLEEIGTPPLEAREALVKVHAASITRDELEWPTDRLPAIPSYELSGVVIAVSPDVDSVSVGEPVYGLTGFDRDGVAAEYAAVPANVLAPKPRRLDHVESAAVPLAALSAWQGLFDHGELEEGQRVLIHGAAGGVGHFATQLARWHGAYVIGTTSPSKGDEARRFGAHELLDGVNGRLEDSRPGRSRLRHRGRRAARSGRQRSCGRADGWCRSPKSRRRLRPTPRSRRPTSSSNRTVSNSSSSPGSSTAATYGPRSIRCSRSREARAAFERSMAKGKSGKVVLRVFDD